MNIETWKSIIGTVAKVRSERKNIQFPPEELEKLLTILKNPIQIIESDRWKDYKDSKGVWMQAAATDSEMKEYAELRIVKEWFENFEKTKI